MNDRHGLIALRQMWETSRDYSQRRLDRMRGPNDGSWLPAEPEGMQEQINHAAAQIRKLTAEIEAARQAL